MFDKKCFKCNNKIKGEFDFCPFCGCNLKSKFDEDDYGLLGKTDAVEARPADLFGEFGNLSIGKIIKGAMRELPSMMKMIEKEMGEATNQNERRRGRGLNVQFFVDGKKVNPLKNQKLKSIERMPQELSKGKIKQLSEFPRVEPKSEVRRLSGRIIYNIFVPGVRDINDIFINQLENSVEVKALGEDKVYSKILKLNLPVKGYDLVNENLVLEFGEK